MQQIKKSHSQSEHPIQFQSSSKWYQKSPVYIQYQMLFRFPKGLRFKKLQLQNLQELHIPTTLSTISTSQGRGNKQIMPVSQSRNALEIPPPGQYNSNNSYTIKGICESSKNMGKSFGISYQSYQYIYQPYSLGRTVNKDAPHTPGPGRYNYQKSIGSDKVKKSMSSRLLESSHNNYKIAPNKYNPVYTQTEKEIVKKFTFGYGKKLDITQITEFISERNNPGPGSYEPQTAFKNKSMNIRFNKQINKKYAQ